MASVRRKMCGLVYRESELKRMWAVAEEQSRARGGVYEAWLGSLSIWSGSGDGSSSGDGGVEVCRLYVSWGSQARVWALEWLRSAEEAVAWELLGRLEEAALGERRYGQPGVGWDRPELEPRRSRR